MAGNIEGNRGEETYLVSTDRSMVEDSSRKLDDAEEDNDPPAVFLCGKCRLPFGDSFSWAGSDEETNQIMLRKTNDNIVIAKDPFVSCTSIEQGCLAVKLTCAGCSFNLGLTYISTPKALDYKRSLFCFSVENIESYVIGSSGQQVAEVDSEETPLTLECKETLERQMTEIKSLAVTLGQRLLEVEVNLQSEK